MSAEVIEIEYVDSADNEYAVPKKQWAKWSLLSRRAFNHVFSAMTTTPEFYKHPDGPLIEADHWETTAWSAAWEAADAIRLVHSEARQCSG